MELDIVSVNPSHSLFPLINCINRYRLLDSKIHFRDLQKLPGQYYRPRDVTKLNAIQLEAYGYMF